MRFLSKFVCALMLIAFNVQFVTAQETALNFAQYSSITYEWKDAAGATHTSRLTDVATNPYQIVALLRFAYCSPSVPGPLYNGYTANGQRENEVYYGANAGGWEIADNDVTPPTQEGYTVFLVSVKNSATPIANNAGIGNNTYSQFDTRVQLVEYIGSQIDSVKLLTDGMRVGDGIDRGTVFNYWGTLNRFFLLSKGQSRKSQTAYKSVPFENMFEEFSPTDGSEGSQTADFYQKMTGGEGYPVLHDCASVLQARHYFAMSGLSGTTSYAMNGLNFFIPDYRMMRGSGNSDPRDMNSSGNWKYAKYGLYNKEHLPRTMLYSVNLSAEAEIVDDLTCNVTLKWHSSIDEISSTAIPQIYWVYQIVTDEYGNRVRTLLDMVHGDSTDPIHSIEDNFYNLSDKQNTFTYQVDRYPSSYKVEYVISGRPEPDYRFAVTFSNEAEAVIPGLDPLEALDLEIKGNYISNYDIVNEKNKYDNYISLNNGLVYKLNVAHLNGGRYSSGTTNFKLYRYTDDESQKTHVGTLAITKTYRCTSNNAYQFQLTYDFTYVDGTQRNGAVHNNTSGTLPGSTVSSGWTTYRNVLPNSALVDFNGIQFCDMFEVSTADNTHPDKYSYVVEVETAAVVANGESNAHSNVALVPVFKSELNLAANQYTQAEVESDIDRHLNVDEGKVAIKVEAHPEKAVYRYDITRGLDGATPSDKVAYAQHTEDGTYQPMNQNFVNQGDNVGDGIQVVSVTTYDETLTTSNTAKYVPVILAYRPDGSNENKNTYGAPMQEVAFGTVEANELSKGMSEYSWFEDGVEYAYYNVFLRAVADVPSGYELCKYRAWRLSDKDDIKEQLESFKYRESADFLFDDIDNDATSIELGTRAVSAADNTWSGTFGARVSNGDPVKVTYIVRLYYKKNTASGAPRKGVADGDDARSYYIAQKTIEVTLPSIPTGIIGISADRIPVDVVYYNALGVASDKPHQGVNMIVTTYSDGSKATVKKVVR